MIIHAQIVSTILQDAQLTSQWMHEVKVMATHIIEMRADLVDALKAAGSKHDWSHITNQIGMFCYSGLTPEQVDTFTKNYHIYMTRNGTPLMAESSTFLI